MGANHDRCTEVGLVFAQVITATRSTVPVGSTRSFVCEIVKPSVQPEEHLDEIRERWAGEVME